MMTASERSQLKPNETPLEYLVLTHHHMDHGGGLRAYAARAALVVSKGAAEQKSRVLTATATRNADLPLRDLKGTAMI